MNINDTLPRSTQASPLKAFGFVALITAWPLINFAISNFAWLGAAPGGFAIVVATICVMVGLALFGLWVLTSVFGWAHLVRFSFFAASGLFFFLTYDPIEKFFDRFLTLHSVPISPPYIYAAISVSVPLLLLSVTNRKSFLDIAFIFAAVAVASSLAHLGFLAVTGVSKTTVVASLPTSAGSEAKVEPGVTAEQRPNIYHVLADQYARDDQMLKVLGYDNSGFTKALEAEGFKVLAAARSNYPATAFSISSMHSMEYPFTEAKPLPTTMGNMFASDHRATEAMRKAWELGYEYLHIDTNVWGLTQCPDNAHVVCLTPRDSRLSNWETEILDAMLRMTPLSYFISLNSEVAKATTIDDVTEAIVARPLKRPQFLFAHTMQPHGPYTREADCSVIAGVKFSLSGPDDPRRYVDAVQCVNLMMLRFVAAVNAKAPNSIVILSSDHGSKFLMEFSSSQGHWTKSQFDERFGVLLAIKGPKRCLEQLNEDMSLVNIYRWAFACVENRQPLLLANRFYDVGYDGFAGNRAVRRFPDEGPID